MKLQKKEILDIKNSIDLIDQIVIQSKLKTNDALAFCFLRNGLKMAKVVKEYSEIVKHFQASFKEIEKYDESKLEVDSELKKEVDRKFKEFLDLPENKEKLEEFNKEEVEISFYRIKVEKLEGSTIPFSMLEPISDYILEDEQ